MGRSGFRGVLFGSAEPGEAQPARRVGGRPWVRTLVVFVVLVAVSAVVALPQLRADTKWDPDALFYEAQSVEVRGQSQQAALASVFAGRLARYRRRAERAYHVSHPAAPYHVSDPVWVRYSAQFYRRRWTVSVLAAAVEPLFGAGSLRVVTVLAYLLVAPLLFLLLRRRFDPLLSALIAAACCSLPMLRDLIVAPSTDTTALALLVAALLAGLRVLAGSFRSLLLWVAVIATLSFTRDSAVVPLLAVAWLLVRERSRAAAVLLGSGLLAAAPPYLFFGASLRTTLAYTFNGFNPPADSSWSFVLSRFPAQAKVMASDQARYLVDHPATALLLAAGLAGLYLYREPGTYAHLIRAAGVAGIALVYTIPQADTAFRFEIALLPMTAVGLGYLAERINTQWLARRSRASP